MRAAIKNYIRAITPRPLLEYWRRQKVAAIRRRNSGKAVREVFREIYLDNRWGGEAGTFNSGSGSAAHHARQYAETIRTFIRDHGISRVVDLGCGDFQVGAQLVVDDIEYIGVDIVEEVVRRNEKTYGGERVSFRTLDIIDDALPDAELCLIRQVLQHLSNEQIQKVLRKLTRFRYVLVTEHYPAPAALVRANVDKPCGEDVRVYDGSAIYLDQPPFNRTIKGPILDVDAGHCLVRRGERIRTFLIENTSAGAVT